MSWVVGWGSGPVPPPRKWIKLQTLFSFGQPVAHRGVDGVGRFPRHEMAGIDLDHVEVRHQRSQPVELARSEEHTSELQSLMRIPYAVFCLNKKPDTIHRLQEHST